MKSLTRALLSLSLLAAAPAFAGERTPLQKYLTAAGEFRAEGNLTDAAGQLEGAFEVSKDPKYLLEAAETYSKAGAHSRSAKAYDKYLVAVPDAPAAIRTQAETEKKTADVLPAAAPARPAPAGHR